MQTKRYPAEITHFEKRELVPVDEQENSRYRKRISVFILLFVSLLLLGGVVPGRETLFPFVKFPMYGYAKTPPGEMKITRRKLIFTHRSGQVRPLKDALDVGLTGDAFGGKFIRPMCEGDETAAQLLFSFLDRTYKDDPVDKVMCEIETWDLSGDVPRKESQMSLEFERE